MRTPTAPEGRYAGSGSADGASVRTTFVVAPRAISALLVMAILGAACRRSAEPPAPVAVPTAASSAPVAPARTIAGSGSGRVETCAPRRTGEPAPAVWAHDGRRVATARGGRLWIFDVDAGTALPIAHPAPVLSLAWSPDDTRLAVETGTEGRDGMENGFELWSTAAGALVTRRPGGRGVAPAFTPDGAFAVFTGKLDGPPSDPYADRPTLGLFDVRREALWQQVIVEAPPVDPGYEWNRMGPPEPLRVVFDRGLTLAAIRWRNGTPLQVWSLAERRPIDVRSGNDVVAGVALSPDGQWLVWGEHTGVERWNLTTHRRGSRLRPLREGNPVALTMHERRQELLVLTEESVGLWDLRTGRRLWETDLLTAESQGGRRYCDEKNSKAVFLPGEARILIELGGDYRLLDAKTGRLFAHPPGFSDDLAFAAYRRQQGAWNDGSIHAIHPVTGEDVIVERGRRGHVELALSADRRRVVAADADSGEVVWFDLVRGEHRTLCERRPE